jgi:hypothetical protein
MNIDPGDYDTRAHDPDTEPIPTVGSGERQRAAIALGVLAIVALVVVGIMVAVLGSGANHPAANSQGNHTGPNVVATGGNGPSTHPRPHPSKSKPKPTRSQPTSRPRNAPVSCPTSAPCDLPDDVGNAVRALNAFRTQHGKASVSGKVTQAARTCAVNNGDNCPGGYFWEPVPRSGQDVIAKIANSGSGVSWLLDDRMTSVQVGWAYIPSSQSFECALISNAP